MDEIYFEISIVNILYIIKNIYKKKGGKKNKKKSDYNYKKFWQNLILIENFQMSNHL